MIIEIDKTIINYLENNKSITCVDPVVVALNTILNSFVLKQHVIYTDIETLEYLSDYSLIEDLNKMALCWLIQKYSTIGSFVSDSTVRVLVYYENKKKNVFLSNGKYHVQIESFKDLKCTQLMAENDSDANLFITIANYVNEQVFCNNNISLEYDGRSFCGGNIKSVAEEVTRKFNITLCISDCDKSSFNDKDGSTLASAKSTINKLKNNNVIYLYPLKVREKENLFPPIFYLKSLNYAKDLMQMLNESIENEELLRFIDIKDGINAKECKGKGTYENNILKDFKIKCENRKLLDCTSCQIDIKKNNQTCIHGVGDNGADKVTNYFLLNGVRHEYEKMLFHNNVPQEALSKKEEDLKMCKNLLDYLPGYLMNDWIEVAKMVLDWCCRISDEEMMIFGA